MFRGALGFEVPSGGLNESHYLSALIELVYLVGAVERVECLRADGQGDAEDQNL